jgi:putative RNA 2'-phosphotransferase
VLQKGVAASLYPKVLLAATREMALRIGKRIDQEPVLLTVHVDRAHRQQVVFQRYGDILFMAPHLPPESFTGPPPPKESPMVAKPAPDRTTVRPKTPGSFTLEMPTDRLQRKKGSPQPKRDSVGWKESRKQRQKQKKKFDIPP